jgi:alkylation response protein AidB-like acyl-CoA dehydrogenase
MHATTLTCPNIATALATAAEIADWCVANARERPDDAFPTAPFARITEAGLLAAPLACEFGGLGMDGRPETLHACLLLLKELGRADLAVGRIYEGHVNALQLIQTFGAPAQVARWAADARAGLLFGVWNTEAADGVRLTPLADGRLRMDGAKTFASGAGHVPRPIVPGTLPDGGWQMCVVPMERARTALDPTWWQPLGMGASVSYKVDFSGTVLEPDDLLGAPGDYFRQPWFGGGAIRFAAAQLGGAQALLDATVAYLRALDRTADPHQRARVGECAIAMASGEQWLRAAAGHVDLSPNILRRDDAASVETQLAWANMTRLAIERVCLDVMERVERSVGARGLLRPWPFEHVLRDLTLYLRQPAPDAALDQVGRQLLEPEA